MKLEERKLREIEHSDRRRSIVRANEYKTDASLHEKDDQFIEKKDAFQEHFSNMKFYSITRTSFALRDRLLYEGIKAATALDYCCGNGEIAVKMALNGAERVVGIDISQVAIDNATKLAEAHGVGKICEFCAMDAEHTEFPDRTFDVIHEYGSLHHLELKAAFAELSRILKPEGRLICTEAMRHNPIIHWYRKRTPHLRTAWEVDHILGVPEVNSGRDYFDSMEMRMFHLAVLAAVPFRKTFVFRPLLSVLELLDRAILSIPYVQRLAWVAVVKYAAPRRA